MPRRVDIFGSSPGAAVSDPGHLPHHEEFNLNRTNTAFLLLAMMLAALAGCSTLGDTWDSTWEGSKEFYSEYVNTDPTVDLNKVEHAQWEEKMALSLTPVDTRLSELLRHMGLLISIPDQAWMDQLFVSFPWISGCVVSDMNGEILIRHPETGMKPLNIQPFVDAGQDFRDRKMRAWFDDTPLGPEIYAAVPVFNGNDLAGFVAVYFDMRNLVPASEAPGELVVVTRDMVQWAGDYQAEARELAGMPWDELLVDTMEGTDTIGGRDFIWMARFIGDKSMIYAIQAERDMPESSWWTFGLF